MSQWTDPDFLLRVWRRREASLLRLLTAKNLASIRQAFDRETSGSQKAGLSVADFVRVMMKLLGALVLNHDELCIQILELFAAIDVNGDRILEWDELLNYIVEQQGAIDDGDGSAAMADYFTAKFAYRQLKSATAEIQQDSSGVAASGAGDASSQFESFTSAKWYTDPETGHVFILGFRKHALLVHALRMGMEGATPVLLPMKRFRHDLHFVPHQVLAATFIPETGDVVTCSRECEGGPVRLAFFNFDDNQLRTLINLPYPCSKLAYAPSVAKLYCIGDEGAMMYVIDTQTRHLFNAIPQGESNITAVAMLPGHLAAGMITGHADGTVAAWDLRAGKAIPGFEVLAHDYGVGSLAYSEAHNLLVSAGSPHPQHFQGLPPSVYAVLVWDVSAWIEDMREGDAYNRAVARHREDKATEAGRSAKNNLAKLRNRLEAAKSREALYNSDAAGAGDNSSEGGSADDDAPASADEGSASADAEGEDKPLRPRKRLFKRINGISLKLTDPAPESEQQKIDAAAEEKKEETAKAVAMTVGLKNRSKKPMRPRIMLGHRQPVTSLAIQEEYGTMPHIVSVDESGAVRVWGLLASGGVDGDSSVAAIAGGPACLQTMALYPVPPPPRSMRGATEMGKAGLGVRGRDADRDAGGSGSPQGSPSNTRPRGGVIQSEALDQAVTSSSMAPEGSLARQHRMGRRLSYSRTSVMLYPDKGEGEAEAAVRAMVEQGLLDTAMNGKSAVVDAILRTGQRFGVGYQADVRVGKVSSPSALPGMRSRPETKSGMDSGLSPQGTLLSIDEVKSVTSGILSAAASMMPEVSIRRQRVLGGAKAQANRPVSLLPKISTAQALVQTAMGAAAAVKRDLKREAEAALAASGVNVSVLGPDQRKALIDPIITATTPGMIEAAQPPSPDSPRAAGRRSSIIGGKDGGNVLTAMLDLRLKGRKGSLSDFALMLQQEAKDQAGEDAEARRKLMSEAQGGIKFQSNGPEALKDETLPEDSDDFLAGMKAGRCPQFLLLLPKKLGGHEKRNLLIVGGERVGLPGQRGGSGVAGNTNAEASKGGGGVAARYGMRMFVWQQDVPDREPIVAAIWLSPTLQFLTATASALVLWDALTGRPTRVFDRRTLCEGREIMSCTVDERQRKAIIGDSAGHTWVINLTSGAVMKELDPRATRPKQVKNFTSLLHNTAAHAMLADHKAQEAAGNVVAVSTMGGATGLGQGPMGSTLNATSTSSSNIGQSGTLSVWPNKKTAAGVDAMTSGAEGHGRGAATIGGNTPAVIGDPVTGAVLVRKLPKYHTALLGLAYTARLEVLSFSQDGSVWLMDEATLGGWVLGSMSSTLLRIFPMPTETFRAIRYTNEFGSPPGTARHTTASSTTAGLLMDSAGMGFGGTAAVSATSSGPMGPHGIIGQMLQAGTALAGGASVMSVPEGIEGGPSVLTQAGGHTPATSAPGTADAPAAGYATAGAKFASTVKDDRPQPGQRDTTIRVTAIAVSARLNLVAACCRVLKDVPHSEAETVNADGTSAGNAAATGPMSNAGGMLDEDSYTIALYDYERCTLLGACTRPASDKKSGVAAAMTRGNALIFGNLRQDGRVTGDHFNAAASLATAASAGMGGHAYTAPFIAVLGEEGEADAASTSAHAASKLDISTMSDILLPSATTMMFLDPLAALLSAHDDGAIRIWATPPTSLSCTLRIIWYLPSNPSNALYTGKGKKLSAALAKRRMSLAAVRVVQTMSAAGNRRDSADGTPVPDGDHHGRHGGKPQPGRRASVGGLDPEEAAGATGRRFATSIVCRPASATLPMPFGTMFPTGHAPYLPGGAARLDTTAPAPIMNIFVEPVKRRNSVTGHIGKDGKPVSDVPPTPGQAHHADGDVIVGGNVKLTVSDVASPDGITCWAGDTDGEIHRWFISSAAIAAAGLEKVKPQTAEDAIVLERRLDEAPLMPGNLAVALLWSRTQSRLWAQKQLCRVAAVAGLGHGSKPNSRASSAARAGSHHQQHRSLPPSKIVPDIPTAIHPVLRPFYAQSARQAFFPMVGETLPPGAFIVPNAVKNPVEATLANNPRDDAASTTELPMYASLPPSTTVSFQNKALAGPLGVVWEGSWRAHAMGDVASLSAIADSGVHALLSGGQDGLARVWDGCGRLLGTLDPQPRFTAPRPDWQNPQASAELLSVTVADDKNAKSHGAGGAAGSGPGAVKALSSKNQGGEAAGGSGGDEAGFQLGTETQVASKAKSHAQAVIAPLLAAVPGLYGPGRGTGYSFDPYSMTHVCTERVFDGRVVFVPLGLKVPIPDSKVAHDDEEATPTSASGAPAAAAKPTTPGSQAAEHGFIPSGADVPPVLMDLLPQLWKHDPTAPVKMVANDAGELVPVPPPPLPGLYGTACQLGYRLPETVSMPSLAVLESGQVAARNKAVTVSRRRSSLSMGLLGGTGAGGPPELHIQPLAPPPMSPTAYASEVSHAGRAADDEHHRKHRHHNHAASGDPAGQPPPKFDLGVQPGNPPPRKPGVYYAAMAPPQRQALWHIMWDLISRRTCQLDGAGQAQSLVKLVKMREMSGWGRRSNMIASAARRLSATMLDMAQQGTLMPRPPGWAEKKVTAATSEEAGRLARQGVDLKGEEAQRTLIKAAVAATDESKLKAGALASVASRVATSVVVAVTQTEAASHDHGHGGAAGGSSATDASASKDHGEAHAARVKRMASGLKGAMTQTATPDKPKGVRFEGAGDASARQEAKASELAAYGSPAAEPKSKTDREILYDMDPVAATLAELDDDQKADVAAAQARSKAPPTVVRTPVKDGVSAGVRKAALASQLKQGTPGRTPRKGKAEEKEEEMRAGDEILHGLLGAVAAKRAAAAAMGATSPAQPPAATAAHGHAHAGAHTPGKAPAK